MSPPPASRRFISLKWKTLALVSVVLAVVHLGLVWQGHRDELAQTEGRMALQFESQIRVLQKVLDQSAARLGRIATIVPGVINALMIERLDETWEAVQVELQLEVMQLYGRDGQLLIRGLPLWNGASPAALTQRIATVLREERPTGFLLCEPACVQYLLTPSLGPAGERRLLLLGVSLADVVLEFPGLAGADVALLAQVAESGSVYWDRYRLVAISDAPNNEPKLRELVQEAGLDDIEQGRTVGFGGRHYRFYARHLEAFGSLTPGYVLIFRDITDTLAGMRAQVQRQLLVGLTALLAALALLLAILSRPMNQLRRLAQVLPMLAHRQYAPVREMVGTAYRNKRSHSEIEVLEEAAVELSRKLEELEQTVAARNQALADKMEELQRANELNEKIFSTAPLIFLIQSDEARVLQMNEFGMQLLGYSASEVNGVPFVSLLADVRQKQQASDALKDIVGGRRQRYEQTGELRCVDGSVERITWLHTRVAAHGGHYLLSVGLPDRGIDRPTGEILLGTPEQRN